MCERVGARPADRHISGETMNTDHGFTEELSFRTSSFCNNGACVEIAFTDDSVVVRDSKNPQAQTLSYTASEWRDFVAGVKSGEFDV
jgi:hypothetical protein